MAYTDSSGSRQDRKQTELWTKGTEQSPGTSGVSREGEDGEVEGRGRELDESRQVADTSSERLQGRVDKNSKVQERQAGADIEYNRNPVRTYTGHGISSFPLYPPGPGDRDGWAYLLSIVPEAEPTFCRTLNGSTSGVDLRLRAIGNGVVPAVAARAFRVLSEKLKKQGNFPEL